MKFTPRKVGFALMVMVGIVEGPRVGHAQGPPPEPFTEKNVSQEEVNAGSEGAAVPDRVPWCSAPYKGPLWDGPRLGRSLSIHSSAWKEAAQQLCAHPTGRAQRLGAQALVQSIMNETGKSAAEAEAAVAKAIGQTLQTTGHEAPTSSAPFAFTNNYSEVAPDPGVATAKITAAPAWCDKAQLTEKWDAGRIGRTVGDKYGIDGTIDGALQICQHPDDPTWRTEAGYIVQKWMNFGHFSQADAEASLRARIQKGKLSADRTALCKALEVSPELGGEGKAFAEASQRFFGCGRELPVWLDRTGTRSDVGFYLDAQPRPASEVLRMYWLLHFVPAPWSDHELPSRDATENRVLLLYAIAQRDFAELDKGALEKLLAGAPYNEYARTVARESLAYLEAEHRTYEAAVDKLAKGDKDYTRVLRDVPKQAAADWDKLTAQWRPELERSSEFEKRLSEPSRSEVKGCSVQLKKDAQKLIKSYKDATYHGLVTKISGDPIANLLLGRLAVCDGVDEVYGIAGALGDLVKNGRGLRGPRTATYYALLEAVVAAHKDRPKLLLTAESFWFNGPGDAAPSLDGMYSDELKIRGSAPTDPERGRASGIVKAVNKVPEGLQIVFKTDRISFPHYDCSDDTSHPLRVNPATGHIEYYRNCQATGKMDSQDNTSAPIVIAASAANGVVPGVTLVCGTIGSNAKNGNELGYVVFVKKSAKDPKLATFFGFDL